MGILLRILGVIWILAGLVFAVAAVIGVTAEAGSEAGGAYVVGAFLGAGLVITPVWLTGIAFFLLPGWIRKQLTSKQTDIFA